MLNKIAVGCLLSIAALPAVAAEGYRSEYRIDMSEAEFRHANELYFGQGLRLVDITVAHTKDGPRIGAIWQWFEQMPAGSPERAKGQLERVFLKLDEAQLKAVGQRLGQEGSQVEVIDAYRADGKTWFAASFAPPKEAKMQTVVAFLTTEQLADMREEAHKNENDILRIDGYADGGEVKLLADFIARGASDIEAEVFEGTLAISAENVKMNFAGMQPLSISKFELGGENRWVATWDDGPPREFIMTDAGDEIRAAVAKGGIVIDLDSDTGFDGKVYYYAVVQEKG